MPNEQGLSKRQMMREKRAREQVRNRIISIGAISLGVIFLFTLVMGRTIYQMLNPFDPQAAPVRELANVNDNAIGDPNAPITITEYSDFQCPFCRRFWEDTEEELIKGFVDTGEARFVYRSFGGFIGQESQYSAEAAYCAGAQGKFWEMHDIIFQNQGGENVGDYSLIRLEALAGAISLNMDEYGSCMDNGTFADRVEQDGKDGVTAGIKATPSFIISYVVDGVTKTRLIEGAQGFSAFQAEIEAALAEMGL